jgi:hypothetical protein
MEYINIKNILIKLSHCTNIVYTTSRDIKDAHSKKRTNQRNKNKKTPPQKEAATMINHSQQLDLNHHQIEHLDYRRGSPKLTPSIRE